MSSGLDLILKRIGSRLLTDVAPKLAGDYAGGQVTIAGMLALMIGDEWDRAADLLIQEIAGLRELLAAGGSAAVVPEPDSLRIADLEATRNALAEQLIALHAEVEAREDDAARALNARIWQHLLSVSRARMPAMPGGSG